MSQGLFRRETLFLAGAVLLGLAAVSFAYLAAPSTLTVAVGPAGSGDEKLITAFASELGQQRAGVRLTILPVTDVREAAQAMESRRADLAVVRPDVAIPQNGLTVAILRQAAAIMIAPTAARIAGIPGLAKKRIGVVAEHEADPRFLTMLLRHYDLEPPAVIIVPVTRDGALAALKAKQIDLIAIVSPPAGSFASEFVREISNQYAGKITVVPIDEADAITQRRPVLSEVTIASGVWGGRPKQPAEEVKTVGVSYRLMARQDIDRNIIAEVAQDLFQMRSRLAATVRSANLMRAPETDTSTSAMLPNHPGAVDYFQREQKNFTDRYGDLIYLLAFFASGLGSVIAWLRQRFARQRRERIDDVLDRLLAILSDARATESTARLDELTSELDQLLVVAVGHTRAGTTSLGTTGALALALDAARAAIGDRRREILAHAPGAARSSAEPNLAEPQLGLAPRLVVTSG